MNSNSNAAAGQNDLKYFKHVLFGDSQAFDWPRVLSCQNVIDVSFLIFLSASLSFNIRSRKMTNLLLWLCNAMQYKFCIYIELALVSFVFSM